MPTADEHGRVALVWDERLVAYDFGKGHPLAPVRVELTHALIRACGLDRLPHVDVVTPGAADPRDVLRLHRPEFLAAVQHLSDHPDRPLDPDLGSAGGWGFGTGDNPIFAGMHGVSLGVCEASRTAAELVWTGKALHAFNPAGGLHHAMPDRASGFCIYNDPAVAIDWLLEHGAERVAYVDIDVHHGDGVETMFVDDPRVLTVSLHESGRYLFPGTGMRAAAGTGHAAAYAVNLPLDPGTTGPVWLDSFDAGVAPLLRAFQPEVLVTQLGCDTHAVDPLAHLLLTVDDFADAVRRLHELAHELCDGRWIATGGGGYGLVEVVPRAWTRAFAEMCGVGVDPETPMAWREVVTARTGQRAPAGFHDDAIVVGDGLAASTRAAATASVAAIRADVLPAFGLTR